MAEPSKESEPRVKLTESDLPLTFVVKLLGRREAKGLWGIKNTREPIDNMIAVAKEHNLSLPVVHLRVTKEGVIISPFPFKGGNTINLIKETDVNANEIVPNSSQQKKVPKILINSIKQTVRGVKGKSNSKVSEENTEIKSIIEHEYATITKKNVPAKKPVETDLKLLKRLKTECRNLNGQTFLGIDNISYGVQDLVFTRVFSMIVVSEDPGRSLFNCYGFVCEDRHVARCITYALSAAFQVYSRTIKAMRPPIQIKKERERKPKILAIDLRTPEEKQSGGKYLDSEA